MGNGMKLLLVETLFPTDFPLNALASEIVELGLAACCQVGAPVTSVYRWEGRTETSSEVALVCKTAVPRWEALRDFLRSRHPYQIPGILAVPVWDGNEAYLDWVGTACSDAKGGPA